MHNYLRNILENFGNFWTTIPVDIYFSSCIQNLFISRNRDLERKSFDHLNHQIGLCVDYQSCSQLNQEEYVKISEFLAKYIFPGVRNNSSLENLFPVSTSIQKLKVMITLASVLDLGLTRKVVHNYLRNILENFENFFDHKSRRYTFFFLYPESVYQPNPKLRDGIFRPS